jgi:branched-chain amino acid aminotransferase
MSKLDYTKSIAFLRDSFIPFSDANISIGSSPVLYGLAIYTVFGVNWKADTKELVIFRLEDHWKRLVNSARIMDFHTFIETWTFQKFEKMVRELISRNKITENALVRVSVFVDANLAGTKIHGLPNSVSAYVYPLGEILPRTGIDVCVSSWRRNQDNAIPSRAKVNGSYVNASLMKNEALLNGYHDAIALDSHDNVCEGTVANLFFVKNGRLHTPSVNFDLLEGITRDTLMKLAYDLKLEVVERPISRSELYTFDEAFVCGSSARVIPIISIDKRKVGDGKMGNITQKLTQKYISVLTGEKMKAGNKEYKNWITIFK